MIKHIAFTMYPVTDMARARRFYEDTLGLRLTRHEASEYEWVEYDLDGGTITREGCTRKARTALNTSVSPRSHSRLRR